MSKFLIKNIKRRRNILSADSENKINSKQLPPSIFEAQFGYSNINDSILKIYYSVLIT